MLLFALTLASVDPSTPSLAAREKELVDESFTDLKAHLHGIPSDARSVRMIWQTRSDGKPGPVICGQILVGPAPGKWVSFATVETDPYEQYIGDGSESRCDVSDKHYGTRDLTQIYREQFAGGK